MTLKTCKIRVGSTFALIDEEDYELLIGFIWWLSNGYAKTGLINRGSKPRMEVSMHEFIMRTPLDKVTDHINRNKLDNRKENLRCTSQSINLHNSKKSKANTSGARNIYWNKRVGKWVAEICVNWERHYLGYYDDIEAAKKVVRTFRDVHDLP